MEDLHLRSDPPGKGRRDCMRPTRRRTLSFLPTGLARVGTPGDQSPGATPNLLWKVREPTAKTHDPPLGANRQTTDPAETLQTEQPVPGPQGQTSPHQDPRETPGSPRGPHRQTWDTTGTPQTDSYVETLTPRTSECGCLEMGPLQRGLR
ncbi:uncharacterized protein [Pseudorca crassidens]|uniref:uncharacterized protein isoform X3 n=1 Tax=Pseudorca crassidens TaxID=82174 RepID=UPI00352D9D78